MLYPIIQQLMQEKYLNSKTDFSVHKQVHFSYMMDWIAYALSVAGDPGSDPQPEAHRYSHRYTTSFSSKKISDIYLSTDYEFRLTKYIGPLFKGPLTGSPTKQQFRSWNDCTPSLTCNAYMLHKMCCYLCSKNRGGKDTSGSNTPWLDCTTQTHRPW